MRDTLPWWSFTIVVTDNETGKSYDHTITVDRGIPPDKLYQEFLRGLQDAALFYGQSGICPGRDEG